MSFSTQFLIYGVSGAASRLAAVVLVPLYTRTLSISEFGQLEVLLAIHALIVVLAGMQIESAIARDYYEAKKSGDLRALVWSSLWLTVAGTAAVSAILFIVWQLGWLSEALQANTLGLLLALTFPAQLFGIQLVILRFEGHPIRFGVISFCDLALSALFSAWLVIGMNAGIAGVLCALLASKTICAALAWWPTFGALPTTVPGRAIAVRMLSYGVPAMPAVLIGWIQNAGSRLLLAIVLTLSDVAIAGIAIKVAAIYGFVVYSFRLAWEPFSMAKLGVAKNDPTIYIRALEWYVAAMFAAVGIAVLLGPYVVRILAPAEYAAGGVIAIFFLLGQFWVGMTNVLVIGIHGARRTSLLLPVYGWGAAINVALLVALAPLLGAASAGIGFLAGSMLSAVLARHYSNKHFGTQFSLRILCWTAIASVAFAIVWYNVAQHFANAAAALGPALALFLAGVVLVFLLLAAILSQGLEPGRAAAMWSVVTGTLRRVASTR